MTNNKIIHQYLNGNVNVTLYEDGTKIREWDDNEIPTVEYPESADVKITNNCDLSSICKYCHEMSNLDGKHGDLSKLEKVWSTQKPGTEMAIGGGNPLAHPDIENFLKKLQSYQIVPNMTVNMMHLKKYNEMLRSFQNDKLIYGLGLSYRGISSLNLLPTNLDYSNVVFHMIIGIHNLNDVKCLVGWCKSMNVVPKILLLGYKTYGNGKTYYSEELQKELDKWENEYLVKMMSISERMVISFDNLAIEQLKLQNKLPKKKWDLLYQGTDGNHTFYVDAVEEMFARTSTSDVRFSYTEDMDVRDMFSKVRVG